MVVCGGGGICPIGFERIYDNTGICLDKVGMPTHLTNFPHR